MFDLNTIITAIKAIPELFKIIKIVMRDNKPLISIKHLVVKSDFVIKEILNEKFQNLYNEFPSKRVYFHPNEIFNYLKKIYRDHVIINYYNSWDETPVSDLRNKESNMYEKNINFRELKNLSEKFDPMITDKIIEDLKSKGKKIEPNYFCKVTYFYEECGGCVKEIIEFKPIWLVLLWIENISDGSIEIEGYTGKMYYPDSEAKYREYESSLHEKSEGEDYNRNIPLDVLQKGESILIPEYILLAPIESYITENNKELKYDGFSPEFGFVYNFTINRTKDKFYLLGPSLRIKEIKLPRKTEKVHEFDITNMLTVSERFNVGSCPYAIGYKDDEFIYIKDILSKRHEAINIRNYKYIIIAEIENEITLLEKVIICNEGSQKTVLTNEILKKGNFIVINNSERNTKLFLFGKYYPKYGSVNNKYSFVYKYRNLKRFLFHLTMSLAADIQLYTATPNFFSETKKFHIIADRYLSLPNK